MVILHSFAVVWDGAGGGGCWPARAARGRPGTGSRDRGGWRHPGGRAGRREAARGGRPLGRGVAVREPRGRSGSSEPVVRPCRIRSEQHDPIGEGESLVDVVGHQQDRRRLDRVHLDAAGPASSGGSARRAHRTARRAEAPPGRGTGPGRVRRAAPSRPRPDEGAMRKRPRAAPDGAAPVLARGLSARAVSRGSPSCTLRSIVRHGSSRGSWKATADRWSTAATGVPSMRTVPASATSSPPTSRSSVDLPQPDGPSSATISPARISRSMSRRTGRTPPPGCSNERPTPRRLTPRAGVPTRVPEAGAEMLTRSKLRTHNFLHKVARHLAQPSVKQRNIAS